MGRRTRAAAIGAGGIGLAWLGVAVGLTGMGAGEVPAARADVILVAGCSVEADGTPSPCLAARVDRAVALWREGRAPRVLLTGGSEDARPTEAEVAAARARAAGVPADRLDLEPVSTSTEGNAREAAARFGFASAIVVTDAFHLQRALACVRATGVEASGAPVATPLARAVPGALREVAAVGLYAVTGRCRGPTGSSGPARRPG